MTNNHLYSLKKKWLREGYKIALRENANNDVLYDVQVELVEKHGYTYTSNGERRISREKSSFVVNNTESGKTFKFSASYVGGFDGKFSIDRKYESSWNELLEDTKESLVSHVSENFARAFRGFMLLGVMYDIHRKIDENKNFVSREEEESKSGHYTVSKYKGNAQVTLKMEPNNIKISHKIL